MKSRILRSLIELAEGKNKNLEQELAKESSLSKLNIQEQAQKCLNFILHHYSDFAVTTIDSFFNSIVKSLAHEMKLPLRFEIELDQEFINEDITERLLREIGKDEKLTAWLQSFAFDKLENNKGWKIKPELKKIGQQLFKEEYYKQQRNVEPDYNVLTLQLKAARKKFEEQVRKHGELFNTNIEKHGFVIDEFNYGKSGVAGYLSKLSRKDLSGKEFMPGVRVMAAHDNADAWLSKSNQNKALLELINSTLQPLLKAHIEFHNSNFSHYSSACEALKLIYVAGIITRLAEHFRDYRDEHDLLTIADANILIKNFVGTNDTSFVFEKTGNKFRHFLLDEFQDTSDIQWKNLLPLINNALASGNSALIVGDVKQAIYRWRGGNMNLLQQEIKDDLKMYASLIQERKLNINYRSTKEVIEFNNSFFQLLPDIIRELEHADYNLIAAAYQTDEIMQLTPEKIKENGYVNISFIDEKEISEIEDDAKWKQESLNKLVPTIDQLLNDGYSWGDIAILVRTKYEGNEIARYLYNNGIDKIVSADSLLIHKAPQVQFIINAIRYLHDQENVLERKEMLYFAAKEKISKDELDKIFSSYDFEKDSLFQKYLPPSYFALSKYFLQLPVYDLTEQLIKLFDLNKNPDAYLQRLQDVILEYSEKNPNDSLSFVNWWDENAERKSFSVITPEQSDSITIITIHKSKGLQYPVVLMPYCDWSLKPKAGELLWVSSNESPYDNCNDIPVLFSKALEHTFFNEHYTKEIQQYYLDNLNLLYVAFTRAAERLYITTPFLKTEKISKISQLILLAIERNDAWNECYNEREKVLVLGKEIKKERKEVSATKADIFHPEPFTIAEFPIHAWQSKLGIKTNKEYSSSFIEYGKILHKILSFIITENDLELALNKAKNIFILDEQILLKVKTSIENIFQAVKKHEWFTGKFAVRNESDIFSDKNLFRPDRLMFNDEETIILDYKTGAEDKSYDRQISDYKNILKEAGFKNVKALLLYTAECKIVEV